MYTDTTIFDQVISKKKKFILMMAFLNKMDFADFLLSCANSNEKLISVLKKDTFLKKNKVEYFFSLL